MDSARTQVLNQIRVLLSEMNTMNNVHALCKIFDSYIQLN